MLCMPLRTGMMANQEQSAEDLFEAALELAPERRSAFLDAACSNTPELRRMVEDLLLDEQRMGSFLGKPLLQCDGARSAAFFDATQTTGFNTRFRPSEVISNRFEVVRFIARGGMGEVYEVRDRFLQGVNVALKIIRPEIAGDAGSARRFEQEVILARKVTHPNLCPIYDLSRCEEPAPPFFFLTMKLLRGETLDDRLKSASPLLPGHAHETCRQLLQGVAALHNGDLLHRDLKPSNVMLEQLADGSQEDRSKSNTSGRLTISIMDFGLARLNQVETVGQTITIAGTMGYMAPELLRGLPPTKATDLFALGVVMHQVLTGHRPAKSQNDLSMIPLPALRSVGAPAHLVQAVEGFLSANPEKRYRAFDQLHLEQDTSTSAAISARFYSLHSKRIWAVSVTLVAVIGIALAIWLTSPPVSQPLLSKQITYSRDLKERPLISDRSRLYFQEQGSPAVMEMTGGTIAPLPNLGSEFSIKDVSADGSKVLALKLDGEAMEAAHGTIWIASTLGGAPRRLGSVSGQDMRWSLDGQSILFSDNGSVYTVSEDGSNQKKLWQGPGVMDSLGYSPDGREITFASIDTKGRSREWRMKADGSNPHPALPAWPADSDQWFGQWTRDGKHFVFLSDRKIQETASGANVYELITPRWFEFWKKPSAALLTVNQLDIQALAPGPDGDSIFVLGIADQGEMKVLDPATGKYVPFLDDLPASAFVISPDRQWMAYTEFSTGNLWKSRLDGTDAVQLTAVPAFMQQWSPDGKFLVYSDSQKIYLVSADGGMPEMLIPTGSKEVQPTWRPDGKAIDYMYWDGVSHPMNGIYEVELATRKVSMRPGTEQFFSPGWSPDGNFLAAMADGPSRLMLYSVEKNAWKALPVINAPWGFWTWSNDSKAIYTRLLQGQPGVYRMDIADGVWTRVSSLQGLNAKIFDSNISMTVDDRPALMSHTGSAQIYSLRWKR